MAGSRRGLTLIELIISVGVSTVLVASTAAVFIAVTKTKAASARKSEAVNAGAGVLSMFEFDAANAGYHWPSLPFAVSVGQGNTYTAAMAAADTTFAECGLTGFTRVPGSDVVEFSTGGELSEGVVAAVGPFTTYSGEYNDWRYNFSLRSVAPFSAADTFDAVTNTSDTRRHIVLFTSPEISCMGTVDAFDSTTRQVRGARLMRSYVMMTQSNFWGNPAFIAEKWNYSRVPSVSLCPKAGMKVYRLARRVRYVLCKDASTPAGRPAIALVRRELLPTNAGAFTSDANNEPGRFKGPAASDSRVEVARDGVSMMQVGVKVEYLSSYSSVFGPSGAYRMAHPEPDLCDSNTCWCNTVVNAVGCPGRKGGAIGSILQNAVVLPTGLTALRAVPLPPAAGSSTGEYVENGADLTFDGSFSNSALTPPYFAAYRIDDASWPRALKVELVHKKASDRANPTGLTTLDYPMTAAMLGTGDYTKSTSTIRLMAGMVE